MFAVTLFMEGISVGVVYNVLTISVLWIRVILGTWQAFYLFTACATYGHFRPKRYTEIVTAKRP